MLSRILSFCCLLINLHRTLKVELPSTSEESISRRESPKQKTSSLIDSSDLLSWVHCESSEYSIWKAMAEYLWNTVVVARDRSDAYITYLDVTIVWVDVDRLTCQLAMYEVLRMQILDTLQNPLTPLLDNSQPWDLYFPKIPIYVIVEVEEAYSLMDPDVISSVIITNSVSFMK